MKILHTADWHIGKKLHKHDLGPDFELFVDWLVAQVSEQEVDVLLVSGDVFDLAAKNVKIDTFSFTRALAPWTPKHWIRPSIRWKSCKPNRQKPLELSVT